jgi:GTPase SAR1 family protein
MDILMLGHSQAGKTSYVSLMYQQLHKNGGVDGFQLRARNDRDDKVLRKNGRAIASGTYPDPTTQRSVYPFVLQHSGSDVVDFTWRDYRGGALQDMSDDAQARQLHKDLKSATALILFSDAQRLLHDRAAVAEVKILISNVRRALDTRRGASTPLVIAVTKCDLVDYGDDRTRKALRLPFLPIIEAAAKTGNVHGAIVPLICGPRPRNVTAPVLFCLSHAISARVLQLRDEIGYHESAARQADIENTLFRLISDVWNGRKTQGQVASEHRAAAWREEQALEPLIEPAARLTRLLSDLEYF